MRSFFRVRRAISAPLAVAALFLYAAAATLPLPTPEATSSISARDLKKHLSFLASKELGGRYTFSPSNRIAARYLASQLESYGYHGVARDGSFFQPVPLSYRNVDPAESRVTLNLAGSKRELSYPDAFVCDTPLTANVSAALVFVGHGISSPTNNFDEYAGLNVKGKIAVIAAGSPSALKNVRLSESEYGQGAALAHGVIGIIRVAEPSTLLSWEQVKNILGAPQQLSLPPKSKGREVPEIIAGPTLLKAIAEAAGVSASDMNGANLKFKAADLPGAAEIKLRVEVKEAPPAQNVVGVLPGSDSKLKDEYVVFSAHYDHLKTSEDGEVYPGADDDGSGTVSVLEIAQAFSLGPRPKRSILVIFHTGEELGLFGSEYNADYDPVIPLKDLVADFNIDMVGRSRPPLDEDARDAHLTDKDSVYIIGADKLSTELHKLNEQTNLDTARLRFDYTYNEETHPERFYYRSDHYNYAKHGVPIIFYFTGVHRDYHKSTDVVEKIDFEKMERIDRMIFATGWRVANLDHRLVVDKRP